MSDDRFAHAYVRYRQSKGYGPLRVVAELQERGIAQTLIHESVDERSKTWFHVLLELRRRRFGEELPTDYKEKAKQMRFLYYRGFSSEQIKKLYTQIPQDEET